MTLEERVQFLEQQALSAMAQNLAAQQVLALLLRRLPVAWNKRDEIAARARRGLLAASEGWTPEMLQAAHETIDALLFREETPQ